MPIEHIGSKSSITRILPLSLDSCAFKSERVSEILRQARMSSARLYARAQWGRKYNVLTWLEGDLGDHYPAGGKVEPELEELALPAVQGDGDVASVLQIGVRDIRVGDGLTLRLDDLLLLLRAIAVHSSLIDLSGDAVLAAVAADAAEPHFRPREYLLQGKLLFLSFSFVSPSFFYLRYLFFRDRFSLFSLVYT